MLFTPRCQFIYLDIANKPVRNISVKTRRATGNKIIQKQFDYPPTNRVKKKGPNREDRERNLNVSGPREHRRDRGRRCNLYS